MTLAVFQVIQTTMTSSLVINFFLAAVMKLSMKRIWGLVNTLQILTILPKLIKTLPSNLVVCLRTLEDVSNLKIIPKETVKQAMDWMTGKVNRLIAKE